MALGGSGEGGLPGAVGDPAAARAPQAALGTESGSLRGVKLRTAEHCLE